MPERLLKSLLLCLQTNEIQVKWKPLRMAEQYLELAFMTHTFLSTKVSNSTCTFDRCLRNSVWFPGKREKNTFERFKVVKLRSLYFGSVWYLHEMKMKILENNNPCLPCLPVSSGKAAPIAPSQATCIRWLPQTESRLNVLTHATSKQTSKTEQVPIMFL